MPESADKQAAAHASGRGRGERTAPCQRDCSLRQTGRTAFCATLAGLLSAPRWRDCSLRHAGGTAFYATLAGLLSAPHWHAH
eukprot:360244-Chlamydomonas_euryale.AAC.7